MIEGVFPLGLAAFGLALLASLVAVPLAIRFGGRLGMVVAPRLFGRGGRPVSYLGGAAIALGTVLAFLVTRGPTNSTMVVLAGALILLLFGLSDDRLPGRGVSPLVRLVVEGVVATCVWATGLRPLITGNETVDAILVVFLLVAATNALNLLDNMDGIAGSTATAIALSLLLLGLLHGQPQVTALAGAIMGACLPFLRYNVFGGRLYLGNGGSLFLGFLLAAVALHLDLPLGAPWSYVALIALLAVPATDTSLVMASRALARRPLFEGGVDHLSHRLARLGFSSQKAALLHAAGCGVGALAVILALHWRSGYPVAATIGAFGLCVLGLLRMSVYESLPEPALLGQGTAVRETSEDISRAADGRSA